MTILYYSCVVVFLRLLISTCSSKLSFTRNLLFQVFPAFLPQCTHLHVVDYVVDLETRVHNLITTSVFAKQLTELKITLHKIRLTPESVKDQLLPLFKGARAVMDLTTVVDSETVARLAEECGCVYINACLEVFSEDDKLSEVTHLITRNVAPFPTTSVHRHNATNGFEI
jgi:homospermidine synthase